MSLSVWLRIGVVSVLIAGAAVAVHGQDLCADPTDAAFRGCLRDLANYGSWMIVPAREASAGELQQAIDEIYKDVQEEWTGPLRGRVHVRSLYVYLPLLIALYAGAILIVSRVIRPRLPSNGPPNWRTEKAFIVFGLLLALMGILIERTIAYSRMNDDYEFVQKTVQRFVHLRSPQQLANATTNPCETYFSDDSALVAMCQQDWAAQARSRLSRLIGTRLTSQSLLAGTIRIGESCSVAGPPPAWWNTPGDQTERLLKLGCEVYRAGNSSVRFEHLTGLGDLPQWLAGGGAESTVLRLEDIFAVQAAGGGSAVYRQKVTSLVGPEAYADYRQRFLATSWRLGGAAAIVLIAAALLLYYARRAELQSGSRLWGRAHVRIAMAIVIVGVALCLMDISLFVLS